MKDEKKIVGDFLDNIPAGEEFCDNESGTCYIKTPDGLIERNLIEKRLVVEDGRRLLTEELPITNSNRLYKR